jgi:hypothetical protein
VSRAIHSLFTGCLAVSILALAGMRDGSAAGYPNPAPLLHRSMTVMQHAVHQVHGDGVISTDGCCPKTPARLGLTGDCVTGPNVYALRAAVHGTMSFDGKSVVAVDFHHILLSIHVPPSIGIWTRSPATHNTWQRAAKQMLPSRDTDLMLYLCPLMLLSQFTQHFPTHLVNLGPVTVHGLSAWHLQDRLTVTKGGMKGTVLESDFYLARSSLYWLRYGSIYKDSTLNQHVAADYSRINVPVTIAAPTIGSSVP